MSDRRYSTARWQRLPKNPADCVGTRAAELLGPGEDPPGSAPAARRSELNLVSVGQRKSDKPKRGGSASTSPCGKAIFDE
jgi:hypothetical protein